MACEKVQTWCVWDQGGYANIILSDGERYNCSIHLDRAPTRAVTF